MNKYLEIIKNLISHQTEEEWFEFKENWYEVHGIGEYIYQHCQMQLQFADRNMGILFGV